MKKKQTKPVVLTGKVRKPPMSAIRRNPAKDKENLQPLYLANKNKESKIGKGSFLDAISPSKYDETLNVTKQFDHFNLDDGSDYSITGEPSVMLADDSTMQKSLYLDDSNFVTQVKLPKLKATTVKR